MAFPGQRRGTAVALRGRLAPLLLAAACGGPTLELPAPAPETGVTLTQGQAVGFLDEGGARVWRGLPFAAPPVGARRWRAPREAHAWRGVREALTSGERCSQLTNAYDEDEGLEPGRVVGSEDCLTLDVYAPGRAHEPLPVMVWIHGGGNVWGRSSAYDGSRLAVNEDVIVVAVQYRLGPLGWFSHPALREDAQTREDASAAFALLDLVAALRWVRSNIAAFGGDAGRVTLFGESAGAHNAAGLLASPLARGLFHRAILQSGSFDSVSVAEAEGETGTLLNPSKAIAEKLGATTAQALRAVPVEALFGAYAWEEGLLDVPRMIEDGVALPAGPLRRAFAIPGGFQRVPILTGTNRDEMTLFYLRDERVTRRVLGPLPVARDPELYAALTHYLSRLWRIRSVDEPAREMTAAGHRDVYAYRFDWDDGGRLLVTDFAELLGAAHGFEIPFVFNRFRHLGDADRILFRERTRGDRERLSRAMGAYWASFARDGVPSAPGESPWPRYGGGARFLRLDAAGDGGIAVAAGADSIALLGADMREDARLDAARRCWVVAEMGRWLFGRRILPTLGEAAGCADP